MGLMDKIKEMFGGGHGEQGERAGQQPGTTQQDTSQYQSGQAGQQYDADADAFGSVTSRSGQPDDTQYQQGDDQSGQYDSGQYQSGSDTDAFGGSGSRSGQRDDTQYQQESDMESEGGHEWER
jgi:hypothetical protein